MFSPLHLGTNFMLGTDQTVPITVNNFELRIYNMDGSTPDGNSDLLTLSTAEIGEISEEQDTITVHYGNGMIKFPSKVNFPDTTWTLNCFCEPNVLEALRVWRKQVFDASTERMGLPSEYMRQGYIIRYDGQGNERDVMRMPGIWPSSLSYGNYNQEGGSIVQCSIGLVISKVIPLTEAERG